MSWKKYKEPKEIKEKFPRTKSKKLKLLIKEIEKLDLTKIQEDKKVDFWQHVLNRVYYSTGITVKINLDKLLHEKAYSHAQVRQLILEALHQEFFYKPIKWEAVWATVIAILSAVGTVLASVIAIILAAKS